MGASAVVTITAIGADIANGELLDVRHWVPFDHAALVAAGRSRADGYDLRLYSQSLARIVRGTVVDPNTAACYIEFDYAGPTIGSPGTSTDYLLLCGDLGWQIDPQAVPSGAAALDASVEVGAFSALTCPAPDIDWTIDHIYAVDSMSGLTPRRSRRHENVRVRGSFTFSNLLPDEWHQLRAWIASKYGGAGRFPATEVPCAELQAATTYCHLESWSFDQSSKRNLSATMTLMGDIA